MTSLRCRGGLTFMSTCFQLCMFKGGISKSIFASELAIFKSLLHIDCLCALRTVEVWVQCMYNIAFTNSGARCDSCHVIDCPVFLIRSHCCSLRVSWNFPGWLCVEENEPNSTGSHQNDDDCQHAVNSYVCHAAVSGLWNWAICWRNSSL